MKVSGRVGRPLNRAPPVPSDQGPEAGQGDDRSGDGRVELGPRHAPPTPGPERTHH